jgi:hypothetical protein
MVVEEIYVELGVIRADRQNSLKRCASLTYLTVIPQVQLLRIVF